MQRDGGLLRVTERPVSSEPAASCGAGAERGCALGQGIPRRLKKIATNRLERRLLGIEKLGPKAKRQITQLLDSFIEGEKLKQRMSATRKSEA